MSLSTLAAENPSVASVLADGNLGPSMAAEKIRTLGHATTESSVRRYRSTKTTAHTVAAPQSSVTEPEEEPDPVADLRKANRELLQKLHKARASKEELVQAVYDAAYAASTALELAPAPMPALAAREGSAEVAVAVLGDWQLAKITPSYNSQVCEERIERYAEKVIELTNIQRADHPVTDLHVFLLGDIIEGELIFPGQHWLIDSSLYKQVCVDGPRILGNFLRTMLANFRDVHVSAVIGNHGRLGGRASRDMNGESNGDRMLYRITADLLAGEDRLTWDIPDGDRERHWYTVAQIGSYSTLLCHGDQFRGTSGMPWYSLQKKVGGWAMGAIPEYFDDVDFGHYHQNTRVTLNRVIARCVGSPESNNTYAQEQLAAVGRPSQSLRFVHPEKGMVTAEYCIWLD